MDVPKLIVRREIEQSTGEYLSSGNKIQKLATISTPTDRVKVKKRYNLKPPKKRKRLEPLTTEICQKCREDYPQQSKKRCLRCEHYTEFKIAFELRDRLSFDHLPQAILENIQELPQADKLIDRIRQLPLDRSVPLMMQYVLNASLSEIAKYLKMSKTQVYDKNKCSLAILRTLLK